MDQENHNSLFVLLVQEFRLWQDLARLARQERQALYDCNASLLAALFISKEPLMELLVSCQQKRHALLFSSEPPNNIRLADRMPTPRQIPCDGLNEVEANLVLRLTGGIQTLVEQISELALGNYALADCALKRLWGIQSWLDRDLQINLPDLLAFTLTEKEALQKNSSAPFSVILAPSPAQV